MGTPSDPFISRSFKRDRIAWIILGILTALIICTGYFWVHRNMALRLGWSGPKTMDPFILVLAYDQIVEQEDESHISKSTLKSHLKALQDEGFFGIGLKDLRAFYYEQKPLPPKSVLLTFNHGYFSTYTAVDPLLRSFGWHGAITLNTRDLSQRYRYLLYWDRLKKMIKSGVWEIVSNGHDSRKTISINPQNQEGRFLTHRQWQNGENRPETYAEFSARLSRDLKTSKEIISENIPKYRVIAYAASWGQLGRLIDDRKLLDINHQTVKAHYSVAFVDDYFGFNNRYTDPHHVKRLHIDRQWSERKLVSHIQGLLAMPTVGGESEEKVYWRWQPGVGTVRYEQERFILTGTPRADIWIPGSEKAENWMVEAEVELGAGQFWLVQQAMDDIKQQWRVGGNQRGIYVQHRNWSQFETLTAFPKPIEPHTRYKLKIIKRGRGVWVELDGQPLSKTPVYLLDRWRGPIGWVAWNRDGEAQLQISAPNLTLYSTRMSMISNQPSQEEVQRLIGDAQEIESIVVPMWTLGGKRFEQLEVDSSLLALLSRRYCWDIIPMISVDGHTFDIDRILMAENQTEWLKQVETHPWKQIFLDLKLEGTRRLKVIEPALDSFAGALATADKCLLVSVSDNGAGHARPGTSLNTTDCRIGWQATRSLTLVQ